LGLKNGDGTNRVPPTGALPLWGADEEGSQFQLGGNNSADVHHIRGWLSSLAGLCGHVGVAAIRWFDVYSVAKKGYITVEKV